MTETTTALDLSGDTPLAQVLDALEAIDFGGVRYAEQVPMPRRNTYRAALAAPALRAFAERTGCTREPTQQVIRDLLTDLHHLTDLLTEEDFGELADRARWMHDEEQTE